MSNRFHFPGLTGRLVAMPALSAAAIFVFYEPAVAQSPQTEPKSVPVLKGGYAFTAMENCLPESSGLRGISGSLTFDPKTGTAKIDEYLAAGNPLSLNHAHQSGTYSNSGSTLTLGSTTYQVTYGKLENGIATYLTFITVESDGCGYQGWLSRQ
jgi:hypothetical protein